MTIVPPLPHDEIASTMAGTSSVLGEPPAVGVQAASARWTGEGDAQVIPADKRNAVVLNVMIVARMLLAWLTCTLEGSAI